MNTVLKTAIPGLPAPRRGKVRDVYDLGENLLIVSTDRISAFDVVLPNAIPYKGIVLTQISLFWFDFIKDIIPNHLITANVDEYPQPLPKYKDILDQRSMLVKKATPLAFECIVRGYLSGSAYKEYQKSRTINEVPMPQGLLDASQLPETMFTPSTKAEQGHDLNINVEYMEKQQGKETTDFVKQASIKIYQKARDYALTKGIIIADTKFEFGFYKGKIILIDEVLTPDSSRFWPKAQYQPGKSQPSFDKQFVRDYLETLDWNKQYPGPQLPQEIIEKTAAKYKEAVRALTGKSI
jgi:phosphoribosylaminoimidazole-succinocarboxamide synthase